MDEDKSLVDSNENFNDYAKLSQDLQNKLTVEDATSDTVKKSDQSSPSLQKTGKVYNSNCCWLLQSLVTKYSTKFTKLDRLIIYYKLCNLQCVRNGSLS